MISKIINRSILILFAFTVVAIAQQKAFVQKVAEEKILSNESYPVDARPYLERFNKEHSAEIEKLTSIQTLKKINLNFQPGDKHTWLAADLRTGMSNGFYSVASTCRAVGTHCYVFVEDSSWVDINNKVDQIVVDSVQLAFDARTPANPHKGIYDTDVQTFGSPSTAYDPMMIILLLDIKDGYNGTGGYVAGYFYSTAETNNNAHIYFLDTNPLPFLNQNGTVNSSGLTTGMKTTAHEFQHMIHFRYNPSQPAFINEAMSMCAEVVNGYSMRSQGSFNNETNHYLFDWRGSDNTKVLTDYARAARYSVYLYEQFGADILKKIVQAPSTGINGITYALQNVVPAPTPVRTFSDALDDWFVANSLNDKTVDPRFGYTNVAAGNAVARVHVNPNVYKYIDAVYQYGAQYITFSTGSNLSIYFDLISPFIKVKAIKFGSGTTVIENVNSGENYSVPNFGSTYNKVTFVVYVTDQSAAAGPYSFSYTSTGTFQNTPQEIAYDTTPPTGVFQLSAGDTVAVVFTGVLGMRLDSIRVALRNTPQIEGGIWRAGTTKFLGARLASFMAAGITTPPSPYPPTWTNWVKVDLRSSNIDAGTDFIAAFVINGYYTSASGPYNNVMVTTIPGTVAYHSYTYLQTSDGQSTPGWYYMGNSINGTISLYLIRAYVSLLTGVKEEIELMPSSFALNQNYPNPFNPSTIISYQLPVASHVSLKVFDILGREVATLINEFQQAGKHNSTFSILNSQLASGIYFYTIKAENFVETKKMILLK